MLTSRKSEQQSAFVLESPGDIVEPPFCGMTAESLLGSDSGSFAHLQIEIVARSLLASITAPAQPDGIESIRFFNRFPFIFRSRF